MLRTDPLRSATNDNAKFSGRRLHLDAINQRQLSIQINLHIANRNRGRAVSMRALDNGIQIGQQLESVKGLDLIAIGPHTQHIDLVINAGIAGNDEDWKGRVVFAD